MSQRQNFPGLLGTGVNPRRAMAMAAALVVLAGTSHGLAQSSLTELGSDPFAETPTAQPSPQPVQAPLNAGAFDEDAMFDDDLGVGPDVSVDKYDLVDLHVNDEDLGRVLQLLSINAERNIIASKNVSATITADLYGVTFFDALDAILHVNGYGYIEQGNFIYVYTQEEIDNIVQAMRQRVSRTVTLNYLNAIDAAEFVSQLLSQDGGTIKTSVPTDGFSIDDNAPVGADSYASGAVLVIYDYEENVEAIVDLLGQLDTKPVQVLVEATILQTSLTEDNAFGVDFSILNNIDFADFAGSGGPLSIVNGLIDGFSEPAGGGEQLAPINGNGAGINSNYGNVGGTSTLKAGIVNEDVAVFLRLLDEVTDVTVVSNPKILTLNRQPARVLVGTRVGYLNTTTTETSTSQTVEFLDTGTQLALRPFVADNGMIRLELKPQVSNFKLRETVGNNGSPVTIPDEETTELVTNVMVRDSQTVVLGGLFTETTTATRRQVPFFGDIPVIGAAFRGHEDNTRRSEIIFMITPSIVNDSDISMAGDKANDYLTYTHEGARQGLLPWSRERRSAQLLIRARELANEGDVERALHCVDRALRLHPQNARARAMKAELSGQEVVIPSSSVLDAVWGTEFHIAPGARSDSIGNIGHRAEVNAKPAETDEPDGEQTGGAGVVEVGGAAAAPEFEMVEESFDAEPIVEPAVPLVEDVTEFEADSEIETATEFEADSEFETSSEFETATEFENDSEIENVDEASIEDGVSDSQQTDGDPWVEYIDATPGEFTQAPTDEYEAEFSEAWADAGADAPEAAVDLSDEYSPEFAEAFGGEMHAGDESAPQWRPEDEAIDSFFDEQYEAFAQPSEQGSETPGQHDDGVESSVDAGFESYPNAVGPFFAPFFPRSVFQTVQPAGQPAGNTGNQASLDMFGAKPINGLAFEGNPGATAQGGASNATGPVLGPIMAPAGSEVLWIPIPDGRMLRIPLFEGEFQVMERGYPLESEQYADAPTDADIND